MAKGGVAVVLLALVLVLAVGYRRNDGVLVLLGENTVQREGGGR